MHDAADQLGQLLAGGLGLVGGRGGRRRGAHFLLVGAGVVLGRGLELGDHQRTRFASAQRLKRNTD